MDLIERLRNFEGSDALGNGDFSLLHEAADALAQQQGQAVYQIENDPDEWFDVDRAMYEGHDGSRKRILYSSVPPPPAAVDEAMVALMVEAFLAETGQQHRVTQLQRYLTTKCMKAALTAYYQEKARG